WCLSLPVPRAQHPTPCEGIRTEMGNSAGKSSDESLKEAVQMLLEVPMVGPTAAAARAAAAVGDGDGLSSEEEHARAVAEAGEEAAAVVR
ncbi:unnamed protein product, partial [Ectocarpus sp. 8 AP-2014]